VLSLQIKHPELPKKPLTPYFRFFMRKRLSYSKRHPNMSVTELTKELSKKYGALSEHKKVHFGFFLFITDIARLHYGIHRLVVLDL